MSHSSTWHAFIERVAYEGPLRIALQPLDQPCELAAHTHELNERVLECATPAGDRPPTGGAEDGGPPWQELARLEARLDLLTELLNRALLQMAPAPDPAPARLNALGLAAPSLPRLDAGTPVLAHIHFDACSALPLVLPGRYEPRQEGGFVAFGRLEPGTRESLDRFVFRHHRQHVARTRQRVRDHLPDAE